MKTFARIAMVLLLAGGILAPLGSADAANTKAEKAREVFRLFQGDGLFEQIFEAMFSQLDALTKQANPELPNEVGDIIQEEILAALKESMPQLMDEMATIYERTFTEEELDAMLAFYSSPVGQSMLKKMPQMMAETVPLSTRWSMALFQNLPSRVEQRLRDEGYDL